MKIIQLIVAEDNEVQGLGDDGMLYRLYHDTATFGRAYKHWVQVDGLPTLAQHVASKLKYARKEDVARRVQKFATDINAKASQETNLAIDALRYSIILDVEKVYVIVKPECIIVTASDDSRVQLDLIGTQYV